MALQERTELSVDECAEVVSVATQVFRTKLYEFITQELN